MPTPRANSIFQSCATTIFEVMSRLAQEHGAINLGQGFPEGLEPADVVAEAAKWVASGPHQYPPMLGLPALRQAVAAHDKRFYGLDLDWHTEVLITSGATEALADCLFGLIEAGDEVVVLEPFYDSYLPIIRRAGGIPRLVRLEPPEWRLPREALAQAFSSKTKAILLNSPMNPCGKVFDAQELDFIASLVLSHDAYAICDEVYEHLIYDGHRHIPLISRPNMRDRCLRIGSAGKTFSLTGWKVGYVVGAPDLLMPVIKAHQYLTFTTPPALQAAIAYGLTQEGDYFSRLPRDMQARRDRLSAGLREMGLKVLDGAGSYFLSIDIASMGFDGTDEAFCRRLTTQAKVACVPLSAFYHDGAINHLARFCFAKSDQAITEALARIKAYRDSQAL